MSTGLKVAFFINGPEKHGIVRASSIIADALCRVNDCSVTVVRSNDPIVNPNASDHFCVVLNEADVVIIHASNRTDDLWGTPRDRPSAIAAFCSRIQKPIVAHLHDVYGETRVTALIRCAQQSARAIAVGNVRHMRPALGGLLRILRDRQVMEPIFVEAIDRHVAGFLVSNEVERERLLRYRPRHTIEVLPHFIEPRASLIEAREAKERLGLANRLVVTLLGFIYSRKGHDTALSMLQWLPKNALLVFAGGAVTVDDPYYQALLKRIEQEALQDRVSITGYLSDEMLDIYLSATDVAICPFREVSASSSFATWLAVGKPIVASDEPVFRLYRSEFGEAITLAPAGDSHAFARLVELASIDSTAYAPRIQAASTRYSLDNTARQLLSCLKSLV